MATKYSFIYSSPSIEALEVLMDEILLVFGVNLNINDIFYYNVFCREETYANYQYWDEAPESLSVPFELYNPCSTQSERIEYVRTVIKDIVINKIDKPEWMIYVEMEEKCSDYELPPSTFLYIIPKEEKYQQLADKLMDFLYSPNLINVIKDKSYIHE